MENQEEKNTYLEDEKAGEYAQKSFEELKRLTLKNDNYAIAAILNNYEEHLFDDTIEVQSIVSVIEPLALTGNMIAAYKLGRFYIECCDEYEKGISWTEKAADSGNITAIGNYILYYSDEHPGDIIHEIPKIKRFLEIDVVAGGSGYYNVGCNYTDTNLFEEAIFMYETFIKAYEQQSMTHTPYSFAMRNISVIYNYSEDDQSLHKAFLWLKRSAEAGCLDSMHELAEMYGEGEVCKKSTKEALIWLEKAAKGGYTCSARVLGDVYMEGGNTSFIEKDIPIDFEKAEEFFTLALDGYNDGVYFSLGFLYLKHLKDTQKAIDAFEGSLHIGGNRHYGSAYRLGQIYDSHRPEGQNIYNNEEKALSYYQICVDNGCKWGSFHQGVIFFHQDNWDKAKEYFEQSLSSDYEDHQLRQFFNYDEDDEIDDDERAEFIENMSLDGLYSDEGKDATNMAKSYLKKIKSKTGKKFFGLF